MTAERKAEARYPRTSQRNGASGCRAAVHPSAVLQSCFLEIHTCNNCPRGPVIAFLCSLHYTRMYFHSSCLTLTFCSLIHARNTVPLGAVEMHLEEHIRGDLWKSWSYSAAANPRSHFQRELRERAQHQTSHPRLLPGAEPHAGSGSLAPDPPLTAVPGRLAVPTSSGRHRAVLGSPAPCRHRRTFLCALGSRPQRRGDRWERWGKQTARRGARG